MVSTLGLSRGSRIRVVWVALFAGVALVVVLLLANRPASPSSQGSTAADPTLIPYKNMVAGDLGAVLSSQSQHCDTIADAGCPAAAARVVAPLQAWLSDLNAFSTPAVFALVDLQLRRHVAQAITDIDGAVSGFHHQDQAAMAGALDAAVGERDFIELEVSDITASQAGGISTHRDLVRVANADLTTCQVCIQPPVSCSGPAQVMCLTQIDTTRMRLEEFQATLVANRAPASIRDADRRVQMDLFVGYVALGSMASALQAGDAVEMQFATSSYVQARTQLARDVSAVLKP